MLCILYFSHLQFEHSIKVGEVVRNRYQILDTPPVNYRNRLLVNWCNIIEKLYFILVIQCQTGMSVNVISYTSAVPGAQVNLSMEFTQSQ